MFFIMLYMFVLVCMCILCVVSGVVVGLVKVRWVSVCVSGWLFFCVSVVARCNV